MIYLCVEFVTVFLIQYGINTGWKDVFSTARPLSCIFLATTCRWWSFARTRCYLTSRLWRLKMVLWCIVNVRMNIKIMLVKAKWARIVRELFPHVETMASMQSHTVNLHSLNSAAWIFITGIFQSRKRILSDGGMRQMQKVNHCLNVYYKIFPGIL